MSSGRTATRAELRAWSTLASARLRESDRDAIAIAWSLAERIEMDGADLEALQVAFDGASTIAPSELRAFVDALSETAERVAIHEASWRSEADTTRALARWIADALAAIDLDAVLARPELADPVAERFYLRALTFGYRLAVEARPIAHGLRDRATRIVAARALRAHPGPFEREVTDHLALVEAAVRTLAMSAYADALI